MTWHARQALPRRLLRTASVLLAVVLSSSMALAVGASEEIAEASARVQTFVHEGIRLFEKNDWAAAREQFLKAWDLLKHYRIAANLAEIELKLGLYREAAEHLSFVLTNAPASDVEAINVTRTQLDQCKEHVAVLDITVNEPGATVRVNGKNVGVSPLETEIFVDPGNVVISAELSGFETVTRSIQAEPSVRTRASLVLTRTPARDFSRPIVPQLMSQPHATPAEDKHAGLSTRSWVLIGGGAFTLAAAGITAAYMLKYYSARDEAEALRRQTKEEGDPVAAAYDGQCVPSLARRPAACEELQDGLEERKSAAEVANAAMASTAVLAGGTLLTYLLWPLFDDEKPRTQFSGSRRGIDVAIAPELGRGGGGLAIVGTF